MPMIFIDEGKRVDTYSVDSLTEIYGVNTVEDLAFVNKSWQNKIIKIGFQMETYFFMRFITKLFLSCRDRYRR